MKLYSNTKQSNNGNGHVDGQEDLSSINVDEIVGVEQNTVEKEDDDDDNLLSEIDFAENEKTKKRKSIAISKILVIVGGTGVFAAFAYLMFGGMKGVDNAKKYVIPNQVEEKVDPLEQAERNRIEKEGELQTELALGTQQRELSEKQRMTTKVAEKIETSEEDTGEEVPESESEPEKPQKKSASSKGSKPRQTSSTTTSSTSSSTRRQYRSAPPVQKSRPVVQSPPPVQKSRPVIQPPPPVQKTRPVVQSPPPVQKPSPVIQPPPPDPQVEIAKAMSYGSYGQMDYSNVDLTPTPQPSPQSSDLISKLSDDTQTQQIATGQIVEGVLTTPIFWVEDLRLGEQPQRFAIELSQPLLDSDGEIFIPEKSLLVAKLKNTSQSGMVILEINGAVTPLREMVEFSPETLTVMSSTGSPLIAESQRQGGGKQNLKLSVMAGLSKVGQLLNRADSTTSYSGFGGVSSHSRNGDTNVLGGILEGAFGELHRQAVAVESEELEEILDRPYIWVIPEGEAVQVFVNKSGW